MVKQEVIQKHDATLGLIFRLNGLWAEVDIHAKKGDYEQWDNVLDRLYCNLLYRDDLVIDEDEEGNIKEIKLSENDEKEYKFLTSQINRYKILSRTIKGKTRKGVPKKRIVRGKWYRAVLLKDIWLRKFMNSLNLYIKETKRRPGDSMFGGG